MTEAAQNHLIDIYLNSDLGELFKLKSYEDVFSWLSMICGEKDDKLIIKALDEEDIKSGVYNEDSMHQVTIKATYGRINGTDLIKNLTSFHKLDFESKPNHKFQGVWDDSSKSLIIDLKEEIL